MCIQLMPRGEMIYENVFLSQVISKCVSKRKKNTIIDHNFEFSIQKQNYSICFH
jgi:hypothetical protein